MKVLVSTVTSPSSLENPATLDALFKTESWQTLMTFTRESARKCNSQPLNFIPYLYHFIQHRYRLRLRLDRHRHTWTKTYRGKCLIKSLLTKQLKGKVLAV